jgi:hypothetical protein
MPCQRDGKALADVGEANSGIPSRKSKNIEKHYGDEVRSRMHRLISESYMQAL